MHGILGSTWPKMTLASYLKIKAETLLVYCLYFVGFLVRSLSGFDFETHQNVQRTFFFIHKQDLFAVSCFLPLLTHRARELGASPSIVGVIGMYWSVIKVLVTLSLCTQQRVVYECRDYNLQVCIHLLIQGFGKQSPTSFVVFNILT